MGISTIFRRTARTSWRNAHVIVAGGSQGIGLAIAKEASNRGARVSLIARNPDVLRAAAQEIGASYESADVADYEALRSAIARLESAMGPCDILVNCAGFALPGRYLECEHREYAAHMQVNYLGSVNSARCVLPGMMERGHGHVVLTSSTVGLIGVAGYSSYGPTKSAVHQFAMTVRYDLKGSGVSMTVLYPPDTETPGFAKENERKPPETVAISGTIRPVSAEVVARALVNGVERGARAVAADTLTKFLIAWHTFPDRVLEAFVWPRIAKNRDH